MCSSLVWGLTAPIIAIFIGVAGIIISAYLYSLSDYSYILTINAQYGMVILLTIFSCVILFTGAFGVCGVYQYSKRMLSTFWICIIICLIGFAAAAAIGLAIPLYFYNGGCLSSTYVPSQTLNFQNSIAYNNFCKAAGECRCYINPNTTGFSSLSQIIPSTNYDRNNYSLAVSVFRCKNWTSGMYDSTISSMEFNLNCAGWCNKNQYFMFSDINKGIPQNGCFVALAEWFIDYSKKVYIPCFVFVGICALLIVWMCVYMNFCAKAQIQQFTPFNGSMF